MGILFLVITIFPLRFAFLVIMMLFWMNTKVWDFLWIFLGFAEKHNAMLLWVGAVMMTVGIVLQAIDFFAARKAKKEEAAENKKNSV